MDAVSALDEVLDGVDQRQSGAHIGLEAVLDPGAQGEFLEAFVAGLLGTGGHLVGGDHGDAVGQGLLVDFAGFGAGGVVHQDTVFQIEIGDGLDKRFRRAVRGGVAELSPPVSGDAVRVDEHLSAVGQSHDAQVESADLLEVLALGEHLVDHRAADVADAEAEDVQALDLRFEEGLMNGLQRLALVLGVDDDGNVALRGALADGPDAHAVAAEGAEGAPGDAALLAHAVTDEGHDGKAGFDDERLNAAELLLRTELLVQCDFGISSVSVGHSNADGVFARPLGDEDHVDAGE